MSRARRRGLAGRGARLLAVVLVPMGVVPVIVAGGCVATAAVVTTVVVVKMLTPNGYKLTIKAQERPRDLYNGLVRDLKADHPDIRIAQENQPERYFEARWTAEGQPGSGAEQEWVSFVVQPLPDETSELVIAMGQGTNRRADYREWALERIGAMMDRLGVEWQVAAAGPGADRVRLAGAAPR